MEVSLHQLDQEGLVVDFAVGFNVVGSIEAGSEEEASEAVIVAVTVEVEVVLAIKAVVALVEEVGMAVGLPMALALPLQMHLLDLVVGEATVVGMVVRQPTA